MRLPGGGVWGEPVDRDQAIAVLRRAVELGINLLGTADSYGPGVAERLIAEALHPYPTDLVIATKAGFQRPGPDQWVTDGRLMHLRARAMRAFAGSSWSELTSTNFIGHPKFRWKQVGTLLDLQRQGKVRHIGLSEVSVAQLAAVRRLATIVSVQNRYNLIDGHAGDVLDYCTREGIGFIPWFPLATGNLARPSGALARAAERLGASGPNSHRVAAQEVSGDAPIPGTSKVKHLEENPAWLSSNLTTRSWKTWRGSLRLDDMLRFGAPGRPISNPDRRSKETLMTTPVVLITGALTGIGRATALAFAHEGAHPLSLADATRKARSWSPNFANSAPRPNSCAPTCVMKTMYAAWSIRPSRGLAAWMWPSITPVPKALPVR